MTTKAVVVKDKGQAAVEDVSKPKLRDDYILVKVKAVAINPTDWKHVDFGLADAGSRVGCDYVGVVEDIGSKVTVPFKKGDRVAGMVHGGDTVQHDNGAFAEYIVAKGDVQLKVPDDMSDTDAATLGLAVITCGQGLYQSLKLPLPTQPHKDAFPVLIYGGSSGMGASGIQYAKLSGCTVVTTASKHNFDYCKALGADAVFDYNSPTCAEDIKKFTNGQLRHAWDTISLESSARICAAALSDEGGAIGVLLPVKDEALQGVNPKAKIAGPTLAYTQFGEKFLWAGNEIPAKDADFEFGKMFAELSRQLLEQGRLKAPRTFVNRGGGGLEGALKGLDESRQGKVSGGKLVYTL